MRAKGIIIEWLRARELDGLYCEGGECGCGIEDLIPCDSPFADCVAAKSFIVTEEDPAPNCVPGDKAWKAVDIPKVEAYCLYCKSFDSKELTCPHKPGVMIFGDGTCDKFEEGGYNA